MSRDAQPKGHSLKHCCQRVLTNLLRKRPHFDDNAESSVSNTPEFTKFPQLPSEIRLIIWRRAYEEFAPRVFDINPVAGRYIPLPTRRRLGSDRDIWQVRANNQLALLAVCQESRYELLNRFVIPFQEGKTMTWDSRATPHVENLLFDPKRDILSFWSEACRSFFETEILMGGYSFSVALNIPQNRDSIVGGPWIIRPLEFQQAGGEEVETSV